VSLVTISKVKGCFHKGYLSNWSEEKFLVKFAKPGSPPTYVLKDLAGETLTGSFTKKKFKKFRKRIIFSKLNPFLTNGQKGKNDKS